MAIFLEFVRIKQNLIAILLTSLTRKYKKIIIDLINLNTQVTLCFRTLSIKIC